MKTITVFQSRYRKELTAKHVGAAGTCCWTSPCSRLTASVAVHQGTEGRLAFSRRARRGGDLRWRSRPRNHRYRCLALRSFSALKRERRRRKEEALSSIQRQANDGTHAHGVERWRRGIFDVARPCARGMRFAYNRRNGRTGRYAARLYNGAAGRATTPVLANTLGMCLKARRGALPHRR
jgi:hypothetical protein